MDCRISTETLRSLAAERVAVVVTEIEGWYLAGLDKSACHALGIPFKGATSGVSKEAFERLIPRRYRSTTAFMVQALGHFDMDVARRRNASFNHFMVKYC